VSNTNDNTPAAITYEIVPVTGVKVIFAPKGFGAENMSRIAMLAPSEGEQGVKDFVATTVFESRREPVPTVVVGVGIGGTFDKVALIGKKGTSFCLLICPTWIRIMPRWRKNC
jgi:fumarate hydratase subunit alpha